MSKRYVSELGHKRLSITEVDGEIVRQLRFWATVSGWACGYPFDWEDHRFIHEQVGEACEFLRRMRQATKRRGNAAVVYHAEILARLNTLRGHQRVELQDLPDMRFRPRREQIISRQRARTGTAGKKLRAKETKDMIRRAYDQEFEQDRRAKATHKEVRQVKEICREIRRRLRDEHTGRKPPSKSLITKVVAAYRTEKRKSVS